MRYILTAGWEDGVAYLTERLVRELAGGKRVLWLTSGGSNIPVSVQVVGKIAGKLRPKLSVMLADERYGTPGHAASNWTRLMAAGFQAEPAVLLPVLQKGLDFAATAERYRRLAEQAFADHDVIIAQLGIGAEGEVAGIMPGSPATAETDQFVVGYQGKLFQRLTLTPPALAKVTAAYIFAFGSTKRHTLTTLRNQSLPIKRQPAQLLKQLPEAYVYSDQFGSGS